MRGRTPSVLTGWRDEPLREVAQVPGAVDVGLSTRGQKPELEVQLNRGLAGSLGVTVGAGRAVAAAGVRRDRRRRLGRSVGRDARRDRAAGPRGARARRPTCEQLPLRGAGAARRPPSTLPLGQVATIRAGHRAGADRPPRSREGRDRAGERRRARSLTRSSQDINAQRSRSVQLPPGYAITQGGEARGPGRGVQAASSPRSASRCC